MKEDLLEMICEHCSTEKIKYPEGLWDLTIRKLLHQAYDLGLIAGILEG